MIDRTTEPSQSLVFGATSKQNKMDNKSKYFFDSILFVNIVIYRL